MPARNNRGYLPVKLDELVAWSRRYLNHVERMAAVLQISADDLEALRGATTAYHEAAAIAANPKTRTVVAVANRKDSQAAMCAVIRRIAKHISGVAGIDSGTLIELGLTAPKERRRVVPPPAVPPAVQAKVVVGRLVEVSVRDNEGITRGKSRDAAGATVFYRIGESCDGDGWQFVGNITRTRMQFHVPMTGSADRVWFCAQWYSNRGAASRMSNPAYVDIVAAGGGSMSMLRAA